MPLFIIHGKKDKLIDYHAANKLYEKYNGKNKEIKLHFFHTHPKMGVGLKSESISKIISIDLYDN